MRIDAAFGLVCTLLCGCVSERAVTQPDPALTGPVNQVSEAIATRATVNRANRTPDPLGSYWRRVWEPEFERLLRAVRPSSSAAGLPVELNGPLVSLWQRKLNEGWKREDPTAVLATTEAVIAQAAPIRDQLDACTKLNGSNDAGGTALAQILAIVVEIVQEADLLALKDSGRIASFEEFAARYPDGPYTASVLFAMGVLHEGRRDLAEAKEAFGRVAARFPAHPLAEQARVKVKEL